MANFSVTTIAPKRRFNVDGVNDEINELLKAEADKINEDFVKATKGFRHEIATNRSKPIKIAYDREVHAGVLKPIRKGNLYFSLLNWGNGPSGRHILSMKPKKPMAFPPVYNPSTSPGKLSSGTWSKTGEPLIVTRSVRQIIKPRRIDAAVARKRQGYFPRTARSKFSKFKYWV